MSLKQLIMDDIKRYMKDKNQISLDAVRMLKSEIKNAEIAAMKEMDDVGIIKIVQTAIKKRKESAELYIKAGRRELADKEFAEIKALEGYLPKQLSDGELTAIIKETIESMDETMRKNFGAIMKKVMPKVAGHTDGKKLSELINCIIK